MSAWENLENPGRVIGSEELQGRFRGVHLPDYLSSSDHAPKASSTSVVMATIASLAALASPRQMASATAS